ncbi:substrate-binding family protein [Phyllobacterium brassicacearum]|nr:substrate-binding family protein [Phyllobacterium brassicacearum]
MTKLLFPSMVAAMLILGGPAGADILIGVGAPLTGPNAAMSAQIKRGAEAAMTAINAAGGVNGEKIDLPLAMMSPIRSKVFPLPTSSWQTV